MRKIIPALSLLVLLSPPGLEASPVLREQSSISFVSKQMGVPVKGAFKRFDADIEFNPKNAQKSRATITIYLDSIDAGSEEASAEIKRRTWFDVKNHPRAEFVSSSLTPLGADRYRVSGRMNIKGNARDVSSDFIVKTRQGLRVFEGKFILNRLDFRIGEGAWSDTGTVASEVEVVYRFSVTAGHGE